MEIPSNHDVRASARYGGSVVHVVRRTTDPQLVWVQTSAREPARRADTDAIERLSPRYFVVTEYCRDVPTSFRLVNFAQVIPGPPDLRHRRAHRSFSTPVVRSVDAESLRLLRARTAGRATLVNCSTFVSEQLKEAGDGHS